MRQDRVVEIRSREEADAARLEMRNRTQRQEVSRTRTRADEVHRHDARLTATR